MSWNNVTDWLKINQQYFSPPICNKLMHNDGVLSVFFVGGPNEREEFHIQEGEEFFYQLKGDMVLTVRECGKFRDIPIREGEVLLLPPRTPHSPQRPANTIGLVIERQRVKDVEFDCLRFYVHRCVSPEVLFERWFYVSDLGSQLPPIINEFKSSKERATGIPGPASRLCAAYFEDETSFVIDEPKNLMDTLKAHQSELESSSGSLLLYPETKYRFHVEALGNGTHSRDIPANAEGFLYQLKGNGLCKHSSGEHMMSQQSTLLVPEGTGMSLTNEPNARTLFVVAAMPTGV
ncbi:3-hydroxyanthranilate 3,4-dioxygenase [Galendromus occidentalis]|uniref:3-hydroxyanthranilate 3,4-dioxygenase n=1 Tax=Galendromus occidentalis TaxID=34638 RepID=A0AAJ6QKF8_9ACAR|nr:3-hydroxyanthranilate 3,4-dioxygenase [Galendromus occidentalis]